MGGPMGHGFSPERADRMVRHLAVELDASADQQAKLQAIVKAAAGDIVPMHEKVLAARQQARALLTAPTVDRGAIEKLRAEQIATMDDLQQARRAGARRRGRRADPRATQEARRRCCPAGRGLLAAMASGLS